MTQVLCPDVQQLIQAQLERCAAALDAGLAEGTWNTDPLRSIFIARGGKKLRRIDEDYKAAACQAVREGRSHSVTAFARSQGDERGSSCQTWVPMQAQQAMAAGWLSFGRGGTFSIACDGSRFSNPGEETIAFACWHLETKLGTWLPVQVLSARGSYNLALGFCRYTCPLKAHL